MKKWDIKSNGEFSHIVYNKETGEEYDEYYLIQDAWKVKNELNRK